MAGQERNAGFKEANFAGVQGVIIMFELAGNRLQRLLFWVRSMRKLCGLYHDPLPKQSCFELFGTSGVGMMDNLASREKRGFWRWQSESDRKAMKLMNQELFSRIAQRGEHKSNLRQTSPSFICCLRPCSVFAGKRTLTLRGNRAGHSLQGEVAMWCWKEWDLQLAMSAMDILA